LRLVFTKDALRYQSLAGVVSRAGVEPAQRAFGGRMPHSLGREKLVVRYGLEPYRSSNLEVSSAYKAPPHTRATDIGLVRSVGFEPTMPTFSTSCVCLFRHERMTGCHGRS
jgi:hypothetical protein